MHKEVPCTFLVDEGVANVVQYLLEEYTYSLIPYTSCEDMNGVAFVGIVVRSKKDLRRLERELPTYAVTRKQRNHPSQGVELGGHRLEWPAAMKWQMNRWAVYKRFNRRWG